jgi:dipeptidyl aminopeptidase/acylaminoacyl peptidase
MYRNLSILFALILSSFYAHSQDDSKKWTIDHIINTEYVGSASFSPDNNAIVWVKRRGHKEKDRFISDLYLTRLNIEKDGMPRTFRLTSGDESDYSPLFSKDGEDIYFLSSREKGNKLWKMSIYGGEPIEVADFKNGIGNLQWLNDHTLAYVAHDGKTLYDKVNEKDNSMVIEDSLHWKVSKIFAFDLKTKTSKRLTNNSHPVSSYDIAENGRYIVSQNRISMDYGVDGNPKPKTYLNDLQTGESKQILQGYQEPGGFEFIKDNSGFYFRATKSSSPEWNGPGANLLYFYSVADNKVTQVDLKWQNGLGGGYSIIGNDLLVSLANGPYRTLAFLKKSGLSWSKQSLDFGIMNDHISVLSVSEDGRKVAFNYSTASSLPEFRVANLEIRKKDVRVSNNKVFVKLNNNLDKLPKTKSEVYKWQGANNEEVNGILYYPENYEPGKKYPLMLSIHGGPTGVDSDSWSERWSTYPQILAQRGAFILKPNYHGSGNHGKDFVESIGHGVYYDLEEIDLINGINSLNDKGMIDMDKLGVMGWSNGAILATMLTLRYPDMFKVCAAGAGDVNWTSDYGTCRFGVTFDQYYFGGAPWDDVDGKTYNEIYITKSPLFEIEKIKTPTIIFHGSEDRSVPRDQGWEYYRGLQQVGIAPVRFLWFPGQPHGLQKITHQKRKMKEELIWIDTYLFETYEPKNEAYKEESPLGHLLALSENATKTNGNFGTEVKGKLVPQTSAIKKDSTAIGIFEVTNAQVKALITDYSFTDGEDNKPAVGLSKEMIKKYIAELNSLTGNQYRLPDKDEAKALHKLAGKVAAKENTLTYWAGYDLTLTDATKLKEKIASSEKVLFTTCGSFKPVKVKDASIYDLGGNAAEYYMENDMLKSYGYSAYDFYDNTAPESVSEAKHCGFRLIMMK